MFSPPRIIMSFARSIIYKNPSASTFPMSPVSSQPSLEIVFLVASSLRQYSFIMWGPRTIIFPGVSGGSLLPLSSQISKLHSTTGFPQDFGFAANTAPPVTHTTAFVSVIPYPCVGEAFLNLVCIFFTIDGGTGAPPPPTAPNDEVSYLLKFGLFISSITIVGTPVKWVTFSFSISCNATSGSHLYIIIIFLAMKNDVRNTAWSPVAWNKGTFSMVDFCPGFF
mmetsp:Transcript_12226/g.15892  ORF Transcript_12226/g.15892 Transcript_12226/m.15892 type:complete len:223 (-) Transcript_12226:264-932(-)